MNNNTNNIEASCARSIVLAQLASDCGKCIYELGNDILAADNKLAVDKCRQFEYGIKEFHILRAIDKINCSKKVLSIIGLKEPLTKMAMIPFWYILT